MYQRVATVLAFAILGACNSNNPLGGTAGTTGTSGTGGTTAGATTGTTGGSTSSNTTGGTGTSTSGSSGEIIAMAASSPASLATASATHSDPLYFAPFSFATILNDAFAPGSLTVASTFITRNRYLLSVGSAGYLTVGSSGAAIATTTLVTMADTLAKVVEAVADDSQPQWFRLDSELHELRALDSDPNGNLVFLDNWGTATTPTGRGYVVFAYDTTTKLLQAKARYAYNTTTYAHTADMAFAASGFYLQQAAGAFNLVSSAAAATAVTLHVTPLAVAIPGDFNPDMTPYQPNAAVLIKTFVGNATTDIEGASGHVYQNLNPNYMSQVAAVGDDAGTATAASTMLDTIETALHAEGAALRYPKTLYLAFRKGALQTTLQAHGIANGTLGMHTVPYVYFTNAVDSAGVHHPFMVLASYSLADKPNRLFDVCKPPGDASTPNYPTQKVTRNATLQLYLVKIPLRDYGLTTTLTDNTLPATLNSDEGNRDPNSVYNYASTSAVAVAVDGVVIYPAVNNTLATAQSCAEVTSTGIHVGQGMGLHYHGDGHSVQSNDLTLYNIHDYPGQSHPPVIGFGFDGVALFGIYETSYQNMQGYTVKLDEYGGHSHDALGYHYHAHRATAVSPGSKSYTLHVLMKGAWKGKINAIPSFWDPTKNEPAYALSQQTVYVGKQ